MRIWGRTAAGRAWTMGAGMVMLGGLTACGTQGLRIPRGNRVQGRPGQMTIRPGESVMLAVDGRPVAFTGLPEESVDIVCWRTGAWTRASAGQGGWRECAASEWILLRVAPGATSLLPSASMCTGCRDPDNADEYLNVSLHIGSELPPIDVRRGDLSESGFQFGMRVQGQYFIDSSFTDSGGLKKVTAPWAGAIQLDLGYRF